MKKLLTLIVFTCFWANANAQYVNIPDANFRAFLISKYPSCFDTLGRMDTTCVGILYTKSLYYMAMPLPNTTTKLYGLQYFKSLDTFNFFHFSLGVFAPIDTLTYLPNTLKYLSLNVTGINNFGNLPDSLLEVNIKSSTLINSKVIFSNNIRILNIYNIPSSSILKLPDSLRSFSFMCQQAGYLYPNLPPYLEKLNCSSNWFTSLPPLPSSLKELDCSSNSLSELPLLPLSLKKLEATGNALSNLQSIPFSLEYLSLKNNGIICLPYLPNTINTLYVDPWICIPNIPFGIDKSHYMDYNICNPTNNINQCESFPLIQPFSFTDRNSDNKLDTNEYPKRNLKLTLSNNNYTYTNTQGTAYINADSLGTYTITAQAPPLYKAVPASYTHTFNSYDTLVYDTFALQPLVTKDSLSIGITPTTWAARSGFKYVFNVGYENVGTTVVNTNLSFVIDTSKLVFDSASAGIFNGNNLSYSVSNFVPGQNGNLLVYCTVKPTAVLGSSLQAVATINGGSAIANDTVVTTIRGSFDPNDKQATPALSVAQVASNSKWIDYTIRFENTGSDTAFTVVVADTLDASKLQTGTVQLTGMSHPVKATQNDNIIFFEFRNINLPDSNIDKVKCNGFVSFKVKPLTSLVNGMTVPNKAAIYFDYNEPVITNTAQTVIGTLPLTLVNFSAIFKEDENKIFVYWNTANEINTSFFIIEQSIDGRSFAPAAEVAATDKGTNSYYYQLNANSQQTTVYLRLKMVDRNGTYTYSNIVKLVNNKEQLVIEVGPNPAKNILNVKASAAMNNTTATIVNAQGKTVKTFTLKQGNQTIDIAALPSGVYYLKCVNGVSKFMVEK